MWKMIQFKCIYESSISGSKELWIIEPFAAWSFIQIPVLARSFATVSKNQKAIVKINCKKKINPNNEQLNWSRKSSALVCKINELQSSSPYVLLFEKMIGAIP